MRKTIAVIFIFVLVLARFFLWLNKEILISNKKSPNKSFSVYLTINNQKNTYRVTNGETALELLQKNNVIIISGNGENAFVQSINNKAADPSKKEFWAFYINGKLATVGAGSYYLKPNDNIEWKINNY